MPTKKEQLDSICESSDKLYYRTYSPGDGVTRYRFFDTPDNSYFGPENGIHTALGIKEALAFANGYVFGFNTDW